MKKIACFILIASLLLSGCTTAPVLFETIGAYDSSGLPAGEVVIENEHLLMRFDGETTQFSITDKAQGTTWHSNPPDAINDGNAIQNIKEKLQSQIILTYGQMNASTTEINNYTLSIANGTYEWKLLDNGIKVSYTIGSMEKVYVVPPAMTESRIMSYYELMDVEQQRLVDNYYRIIDINRLRATDNEAELLAKYPEMEHERIFELRAELQGHILERIEAAFEAVGYTTEDFIEDSGDAEALGGDKPVFNISVIYALDGRDFTVTVPLDEIEFRHDYPILSLTVLPFFGAAGLDDEGFMFVPDASGALIYNNNNKHDQTAYNINMYGFDSAIKRSAIVNENYAYMPVFGVSREDDSFICVIEDGECNSGVEADVSMRLHSYNSVNSRFTVTNWDDIDISKANLVAKVFDRSALTGSLSQRYIFVPSPDYVSMAAAYRGYLMERYPTLKRHNETELPVVLGLIGAIDRMVNVMGVPTERTYPLTTYSQAADIIERFSDTGMSALRVNYMGWFNGGVMHDAPGKINLLSELGGRRDFAEMLARAGSSGAEVYFEADFSFIYNDSMFNGFNTNRDGAKRLSRELARIYPYSFVWYGERTGTYGRRYSRYLANPAYTMGAIDSFSEQLREFGGSNIAFSSIGRSLNSDFNVRKPSSRGDAMRLQQGKLEELMAGGARLMLHGGNAYAAPFADIIIDTATEANNFNIIDESIPFYQIVFHGLIPYTGSPLNLSPDYARGILKAAETGAGLQFVFMDAPGEALALTNYTRYFACDIARWGDEPIAAYKRLNDELRHTAALLITGHRTLAPLVTLTEYEDGTQVIVNYSSEAYSYEGIEVPTMDFVVKR